jgi:hypothetical protein
MRKKIKIACAAAGIAFSTLFGTHQAGAETRQQCLDSFRFGIKSESNPHPASTGNPSFGCTMWSGCLGGIQTILTGRVGGLGRTITNEQKEMCAKLPE